ncbi:ABC transporter permease [Actinomadura craniellae]|uniref:ABC transporter permease n=1 Tax=Actinomadura craniellae TaxID=2231787 RepID=A0A365HC79_9ACTN|nr:ABC transporter permease [Actinomadura craniellae]RAY16715.1 ABC transporter permease [Actinomadura craniellae]
MTAVAVHAGAHARGGSLTGTGALVRFALRRDRVRIPVWIAALTFSTVGSVSTFPTNYPTVGDRQTRAELMTSPTGAALSGPGHGLDDYTFGAMMGNEILGFLAIFVALMSVLLFVRHTRTEEESGRAELVRAAVVGRHAVTTAALIVVGGTNLVLGALIVLGLGTSGVESITWAGSLAFGAGLTAVGLLFTAITAVTAQLVEYARGAAGLAGALIGLAYALRAAGDMGDGALSWLSPIGWAQAMRPYVDERWWPLVPAPVLAVALVAVAFALTSRRDVGAGLVRPRPGPRTGSGFLGTPFGLALRLHRAALLWWGTAMFLFGLMYGSLIQDVESAIEGNRALREWVAQSPGTSFTDAFLALILSMLATISAIYAILAAQRLRGEETAGRAEPVLATATSRARWMSGQLAVALFGGAAVILLSALGLGLGAAATAGDAGQLFRILGAGLCYVPALWVTVGVAVALFGLAPRAIALSWVLLVYALTVGIFSGLLKLPSWTMNLSPFGHVPQLPGAEFDLLPLVALTALAAALVAAGLAGFRRRDLHSN